MNELLNRVSEKYDYVIIDTSPAGILTDQWL
jgi:Mrp family chromosome partitioning ATPase